MIHHYILHVNCLTRSFPLLLENKVSHSFPEITSSLWKIRQQSPFARIPLPFHLLFPDACHVQRPQQVSLSFCMQKQIKARSKCSVDIEQDI